MSLENLPIENSKKKHNLSKFALPLLVSLSLTGCQDKDYTKVRVQKGDSLIKILRDNGIEPSKENIDLISKLNKISDPSNIKVGQIIKLPKNLNQFKTKETSDMIEKCDRHQQFKVNDVLAGAKKSGKLNDQTVVVDPGHGGDDPGAIIEQKNILAESEIAYDIALRFGRILSQNGVDVYFTRYNKCLGIREENLPQDGVIYTGNSVNDPNELSRKDVDGLNGKSIYGLSQNQLLDQKVEFANKIFSKKNGKNVSFISFHLNSYDDGNTKPNGRQVVYFSNSVLSDKMSQQFAQQFQQNWDKNSKVQGKNFRVLNQTEQGMNSILIEMGNINRLKNPKFDEYGEFRTPAGREKLAQQLAQATIKTLSGNNSFRLENLEGKNNSDILQIIFIIGGIALTFGVSKSSLSTRKKLAGIGLGATLVASGLMLEPLTKGVEQLKQNGIFQKNYIKPQKGEGLNAMLRRNGILNHKQEFMEMNKIDPNNPIINLGQKYKIDKSWFNGENNQTNNQPNTINTNIKPENREVSNEKFKKLKIGIDEAYELAAKYDKKISITKDQAFALAIKESNANPDSVSRTGAKGYMQLKQGAIDDVNRILGLNANKFEPLKNPVHNIFYGLLYFSKTYETLKSGGINKDIFHYTLAAYNGGANRTLDLYEKFGNPNRNDFEKKLLELVNLDQKDFKYTYSDTYNLKYKNYFYKKDLEKDNTVVWESSRGGHDTTFDASKLQEMVNYVQKIKAIHTKYH